MIFIGLISYSLYLWHWPIISFLKYIFINSISIELILLSTITIFSLSFLRWKYIEQPFLIQYSKKTIFSSLITGYLILILGSFIILKSDNFPSRYEKLPNDLANSIGSTYSCSISEYIKFGDTFACLLNSKNESQLKSILFGNSHAYMYGWGFKEHLQDIDQKGIIIQLTSCLPFIDKNISQKCLEKSKNYYDSIIARESLKNIILGFTWDSNRLVDDEGNIFIDKDFNIRKKSIDYLIKNFKDKGRTVFLIGPILTPEKEFSPEILSREIIFKAKNVLLADGGFQFNRKLFEEFIGGKFDHTCQRGARTGTGDGIKMAHAAGAKLSGMDKFYGHLLSADAVNSDKLWPYPELDAVATAGIVIDSFGTRVADEGKSGVYLTNALAKSNSEPPFFIICDASIWESAGRSARIPANPLLEEAGGTVFKSDTLEELAEAIGVPVKEFVNCVAKYNEAIDANKTSELLIPRSQNIIPYKINTAPFIAIPTIPGITYTMGGIVTDEKAQVLNENNMVIPGLLAAGATTGGLEEVDRQLTSVAS